MSNFTALHGMYVQVPAAEKLRKSYKSKDNLFDIFRKNANAKSHRYAWNFGNKWCVEVHLKKYAANFSKVIFIFWRYIISIFLGRHWLWTKVAFQLSETSIGTKGENLTAVSATISLVLHNSSQDEDRTTRKWMVNGCMWYMRRGNDVFPFLCILKNIFFHLASTIWPSSEFHLIRYIDLIAQKMKFSIKNIYSKCDCEFGLIY